MEPHREEQGRTTQNRAKRSGAKPKRRKFALLYDAAKQNSVEKSIAARSRIEYSTIEWSKTK